MKPSALARSLTPDQREKLVHDARALVRQHQADMQGFYDQRKEYERQSNDDFSSRRSGTKEPKSIFDLSNESLNLVRNVTRFMRARCCEDIFGTKPFVAITPAGPLDGPIAEQMGRHGPWKLDQAEYSKVGKEAIGLALDLGECVLKTSHRTERDLHDSLEMVLVDKKTGKEVLMPLFDSAGNKKLNAKGEQECDYIYSDDPTFVIDEEAGTRAYEKWPELLVSEDHEFRETLIEEDPVVYHGLDVATVRFDAFVAPLNVRSLKDADCVAHIFTRRVSELRAAYGDEKDEENQWLFEQLEAEPDGTKSAEDEPRDTYGEVASPRQTLEQNPNVKVMEVYLRNYDVFGDGRGRNIFLVLAADQDVPLFVEYQANITARGRLPFHAIVVNRVPGRWYGRGFYNIYGNAQELIDALINAILFRNENNADPLTCWQPDATEEGVAGEKRLSRFPGKTITLRPGKTAKDAVALIEWPDLDERTWQLVQLIMQLVQTDSGVTSAAQGDYSALPSASTATGVSSILQSASTLHRMLTEDLKDCFEPAVVFGLLTIYANQDQDETFTYLEGEASEVLSLSTAQVLAKLEVNVRILLTRFQMREQREQALLIIKETIPLWTQLLQASGYPLFDLAAAAQPLFVQVAKGADIQNAEKIFILPQRVPNPEEEKAAAEAEAAAAEEAAAQGPSNVIPDEEPVPAAA